jgi:hypothetical protein
MNDSPEPSSQPNSQPTLRHEKIIVPLDISIQPSKISTQPSPPNEPLSSTTANTPNNRATQPPQQVPEPQPVANPYNPDSANNSTHDSIGASNQLEPQNCQPSDDKKHNMLRAIKLVGILILGAIAGVCLYFALVTGTSSDLLDQAFMQASFYRPNVVLSHVVVGGQLIVLVILYWLLLRFIFRSQRAFKQALSTLLISQLIIIGIVALAFSKSNFVHLVAINLVVSSIVGANVFFVCNYLAEKPWSWKISRLQITLLAIAIITALDFTASAYASNRHTSLQQQEKKQQTAAAAKVKKDTSINGDNSTGYELFYPNTKSQEVFRVTSAGVGSSGSSPDDFDAQEGVPPFSEVDFTNIAWSKNTLHLYMLKPTKKAFNSPSYCGDADPRMSIPLDYNNQQQSPALNYSCYIVANIPGLGTLYGAVPGSSSTEYPESQELAEGLYTAYYVQTDKTLLTLDNSPVTNANNKIEMLTSKDAIGFFSNLAPISPSDLLAKSQQLAASQKAAQSSPQTPTYTVYTPTNTAGLTLKKSSIDRTDPSNPVVVLSYYDGNAFDTSNINIDEYAKPSNFNPPQCGGGSPGAGSCTQVGQTSSGEAVYYASYTYWVDFDSTTISINGLTQAQMSEAMQFYNGMQATTIQALRLQ